MTWRIADTPQVWTAAQPFTGALRSLSRKMTEGVVSQPHDPGRGSVRILIVEDDYLISEGVRDACHEAGYDVVGIAVDAAQAISIAERERPDLVLMDIKLSGDSDGVEVASLLRDRFGIRSIPFAQASGPRRGQAWAQFQSAS